MKRYIEALCLMTVCLILNTSCLGSDDDSKVEYANDTAIKTFSLTTVNRYVHTTTKAGKDTIYKKALSNPVVFTIDQYQDRIYNTDSLPADCDIEHVLASITSVNSGTITLTYEVKIPAEKDVSTGEEISPAKTEKRVIKRDINFEVDE